MKKESLDRVLSLLEGVPCDEYALMHEAAVTVWGLNYSVIPRSVDVLVAPGLFERLAACEGVRRHEHEGEAYLEHLDAGCGVPARYWGQVGGVAFDPEARVWSAKFERPVLDPELTLQLMPHSPEWRFLLEQRARLAEVLYFDDMTDEELATFHRYVRGN